MLPRLAPRRGSRRRSSTQFPPTIPPPHQQLRPHRTAQNVQGQENNIDVGERQRDNDKSEIDLLASSVSNIDSEASLPSTPSSKAKPPPCSGTVPPWSPPRSMTTKKDHANECANKNMPTTSKNEGCTTPTNNSQEFYDFPPQPYFMTSTRSSFGHHNDASLALTPPASAPAPLLVSAKRLGTEVRSIHSKRRRASWRGYLCSTEKAESNNDGNDEELQPMVYTDQLDPKYGRNGPIRMLDRWKEEDRGGNEEDPFNRLMSPPLDDDDDEPYPLLPAFMQTLSPQEQKRCYWQLCYGSDPPVVAASPPNTTVANNTTVAEGTWSASRAPPTRSCLSSAKKASFLTSSTMTPASFMGECWTPKASPEDTGAAERTTTTSHSHTTKSVQFGSPKAAEYEIGAPSVAMTPLPADVARARFPVDDPDENPRNQHDHELELELIKQTKINSEVLQGWEMSFDDFDPGDYDVEDDERYPNEVYSPENVCNTERLTPIGCILPPMDDEFGGIKARARQQRRNSGFFSQRDISAAFLSSSESDEEENTDEEDEDIKITAAESDGDDSIANHIANLTMVATTTARSEVSTPTPVTADQTCRNDDVLPLETTPPLHSEEPYTEITPPSEIKVTGTILTPPSDISYSSVHTTGAAFAKSDIYPAVDARPLFQGRALKYGVDGDLVDCEDKTAIGILAALRNDKLETLASEWDTGAMLGTMARYGNHSLLHPTSDHMRSFLAFAAVNKYYSKLVPAGVDAVVAQVDGCLTTNTPAMPTATTIVDRVSHMMTSEGNHEWIRIEKAFWNCLDKGLEDMEDELSALSKGISCSVVPEVELNEPRHRHRTLKRQRKRLEKSILDMHTAISKERRSQDLKKAELSRLQIRCDLERSLPFSVLAFRVTADLLSFRMVRCTEGIAVWRMDHAVGGVESEVTLNMETGKLCGSLVRSDDETLYEDKIARDHVASLLHQILAVRCIEESGHFNHNNDDEISEEALPNCLAHLAIALGRIDLVVRSLWLVGEEQRAAISLQTSVSESNETAYVIADLDGDNNQKKTLRITFDSSSALPFPSKVEVAMNKVGSSDYLVSGWNDLDDWRCGNQPWETKTLFQDIISAAAMS